MQSACLACIPLAAFCLFRKENIKAGNLCNNHEKMLPTNVCVCSPKKCLPIVATKLTTNVLNKLGCYLNFLCFFMICIRMSEIISIGGQIKKIEKKKIEIKSSTLRSPTKKCHTFLNNFSCS